MSWTNLQASIDACANCKSVGHDLIIASSSSPARPPYPRGGEVLFISEAPPLTGGFWNPRSEDSLRQNLFEILCKNGVNLPGTHAAARLHAFTAANFFLIQTVKWPLYKSAAGLGPAARSLIEHSVECHLTQELDMIRPQAIIPLGKVACYAAGRISVGNGFVFDRTKKLEDVRGKVFCVQMQHGCVPLFPTGLPVKRKIAQVPKISREIGTALKILGIVP